MKLEDILKRTCPFELFGHGFNCMNWYKLSNPVEGSKKRCIAFEWCSVLHLASKQAILFEIAAYLLLLNSDITCRIL